MKAFFPDKEDFQEAVKNSVKEVAKGPILEAIRKATSKEIYTISEVCTLLDVSRRHLQHLRDTNQIGYVKNGRKIYFKREDLEEFFDENYIPALNDEEGTK